MELVNASNSVSVIGAGALSGRTNYFKGRDPAVWHTDVPTYSRVEYRGVYQGIDLVFYGQEQQLEYDFVVAPHSDPKLIAFHFGTATVHAVVDRNGDLVTSLASGDMRLHRPLAYQLEPNGRRRIIQCRFVVHSGRRVSFQLGSYDHAESLVIDPVLTYSTYLGGSADEGIFGIKRDGEGNLYISGETSSLDFPINDPAQPAKGGDYDGFVAKFNPDATRLIYSTYLGGSSYDHCVGLAVDWKGDAYVAGETRSPDFPLKNALQTEFRGQYKAFVAHLDRSGSKLVFSTYLGGEKNDYASDIAIDWQSNVYVDGFTNSIDFPVTSSAFQKVCDNGAFPNFCSGDAFLTKLDSRGSKLIYSTYLGGASSDSAGGLAVDYTGAAYITGQTSSMDFPTRNPYQGQLAGVANAFITKLSSDGGSLVYSTYLGGSQFDSSNGIAIDFFGNAYITGFTSSPDFPVARPIKAANNSGSEDGFVSKLSSTGSELVYSTLLGGAKDDFGWRIAVDIFGSASVIGFTFSTDFPVQDALQPKFAGGQSDAFVSKLSPNGTHFIYSTYLGGSGDEYGYSIDSGLLGSVWVGGSTSSLNYPVKRAYQSKYAGGIYDAFLSRIKLRFCEELDLLADLINESSDRDALSPLLDNIRLSIGTGTVGVTLDALQRFSDRVDTLKERAQLHAAVTELIKQVSAHPDLVF